MMDVYISNFPIQLNDALNIANQNKFSISSDIKNVVIAGMGGSGISGTFALEYAYTQSHIPIYVVKSYHLPQFVNEHTLVILSSYSGNTEENISCFKDAVEKKAKIVAITSGGKLATLCQNHQYPVVSIPSGYPPRTCLGYSIVQVFNILQKSSVIDAQWQKEIQQSIHLLHAQQNNIKTIAKQIAQHIHQHFPIIYSLHSEALAIRLRQQLNENSKILCSHHIIPEMNHNELVGWKNLYCKHIVMSILTDYDLPQNRKRYEFCKSIFQQHKVNIIELKAIGNTLLEQWMYIIHLSDWISYELALINQSDPIEVKVIDTLKQTLNQ